MALLTTEDVYNKKFTRSKRRGEGYDEDEVDEFLDEVIVTIRDLGGQRDESLAKLEAAERRIAELTSQLDEAEGRQALAAPGVAAEQPLAEQAAQVSPLAAEPTQDAVAEPAAEPVTENAPETADEASTESVVEQPASQSVEQPAEAPLAAAAPVEPVEPAAPESAAGMLALAQRVHDEYVANGRADAERALSEARAEADRLLAEARGEHERLLTEARGEHERVIGEARGESDRLLTDARGESDRLLTDARGESERLVREAEENHNRTLASLEQEKGLLERKIEELQVFERDYRTRLKSYLEKLLSDVDGRVEPAQPQGEF